MDESAAAVLVTRVCARFVRDWLLPLPERNEAIDHNIWRQYISIRYERRLQHLVALRSRKTLKQNSKFEAPENVCAPDLGRNMNVRLDRLRYPKKLSARQITLL